MLSKLAPTGQPAIQDLLNEKNHYMSFELTLWSFSGILRALPCFSLTTHVHINATDKGVHLTKNVEIVPRSYKAAYTSCPKLHLYSCMKLLSWMLQKLHLTVYMIDQIFRSQGLPKALQRFSESNSPMMEPCSSYHTGNGTCSILFFAHSVTSKYCGIPAIIEKVNSLFSYFKCMKYLRSS